MSHDPLCFIASLDPTSYDYEERAHYDCQCDLVARVRADNDREWLNNRGKSMVYAAALRDAVEAVKAIAEVGCRCNNCADAVAAIEALGDTPPRQPKEHINPTGYDPAATDNRP